MQKDLKVDKISCELCPSLQCKVYFTESLSQTIDERRLDFQRRCLCSFFRDTAEGWRLSVAFPVKCLFTGLHHAGNSYS